MEDSTPDVEPPGARHTTLRWGAEQAAVVRRAARRYGLPYQAYVRDAAFRRALEDLRQLGEPPPSAA